jgi:dTDP-4-amino-4,6-dideoxygalactose transaminase
VIQAHLFGRDGGMEVAKLCRDRGVLYIADCAQLVREEVLADLCRCGPCCFSFGESKTIRIGEGGAVATNSSEFAERVRLVRHEGETWLRHGTSRLVGEPPSPRDVLEGLASVRVGLNYRPSALLAALARIQLQELPITLARTRDNAERLLKGLFGLPKLTLPAKRSSWWTFPILVEHPLERDVFLAALLAEGIPVGVHFPRLMSDHPVLRQVSQKSGQVFPNAELFARQHLVLPIFTGLGPVHMDRIADGVRKVLKASEKDLTAMREPAELFLSNRRIEELSSGLFFYLAPEKTESRHSA